MRDGAFKSELGYHSFDLVSIGELLIDFVGTNNEFTSSIDEQAETYQANPGGAPANVACTAQKLGLQTAFIGAVGHDHFGRLLIHELDKHQVNTSGISTVEDAFTTLAFVSLDEEANRSFSFARKPGADTLLYLDQTQKSIITKTKILHFGTLSLTDEPSRSSTVSAVEQAKQQGSIVSFDPNVRLDLWSSSQALSEQIEWGIYHCDILKASEEDLAFFEDKEPEDIVISLLTQEKITLALLSQGPAGSKAYWRASNGEIQISYAPVDNSIIPIDTTGAGDIFTGSFLSSLMQKMVEECSERVDQTLIELLRIWLGTKDDLSELLNFANQVAGLSTRKYGGISSIPSLSEWAAVYKD